MSAPAASDAPGTIAIMGAGAVGSYVGGMLTLAGERVVLIDAWPAHVERMRARGLTIEAPEGTRTAHPTALHLGEVQALRRSTVDLAFLCAKLYDTDWATLALLPQLMPEAPLVTMQNGLIDDAVAGLAGAARTLGAVAGGLDVALAEPGRVCRSRRRGAGTAPIFKVGELDERTSPRAQAIAALLGKVDTAAVTTTLRHDRWLKLCANAVTSGLSGISGLPLIEIHRRDDTRRLAVRLGAEVLAVGAALGYRVAGLFGVAPARWAAAHAGDALALADVMDALAAETAGMVEGGQSSTLQDLLKGRRTEVDYFNGYVAAEAARCGVPAPTHAALAAALRRMEGGAARPGLEALAAVA
jgi:2-dehydropantoate 2-reductase